MKNEWSSQIKYLKFINMQKLSILKICRCMATAALVVDPIEGSQGWTIFNECGEGLVTAWWNYFWKLKYEHFIAFWKPKVDDQQM